MKEKFLTLEGKLWLGGSVALILLGCFSFTGSWKAALILLLAGLIINPIIFGHLLERVKLKDRFQSRIAITWVFLVVATITFQSHQIQKAAEAQKIAELEAQKRSEELALARAEEVKRRAEAIMLEFSGDRERIISDLSEAIAAKDAEKAKVIVERYSAISDMELMALGAKYQELQFKLDKDREIKALLDNAKSLKIDDYASAVSVYSKLVQLDPNNSVYQQKLARLEKIKADSEEKARKKLAEQKAREARDNEIKSQFSAWDGSHREFERIIKESMNDPDSYDHVETRYIDEGTYIRVFTKFRGKNAFGGVVVDSATADFTLDGTLLRVVEE